MQNKNIVEKNITELIPYANNARSHSDYQIGLIASSIQQFGFNVPILIDENNTIIAGHGRLQAAYKLNLNTVPTISIKHLSEAQKKAYTLADNKIAEMATWDEDMLASEFDVIKELDCDIDLEAFGFDLNETDDFDEDKDNAFMENNEQKKIFIKKGDLLLLGKHRLNCDDSLKVDFSDDVKSSIVFTDPPYELEGKVVVDILNKITINSFILLGTFRQLVDILNYSKFNFHFDFILNAHIPKSFMNRKQPYYTHQNGVYLTKNNQTIFNNDNSKGRRSDDNSDTGYWHTIIDAPRNTQIKHGHAKSVKGMCDVLAGFEFDKIVDPFAGSGTSLLCSEHYNVEWHGVEIEPEYCQIIADRYIEHKGNNNDVFVVRNGEKLNYDDLKHGERS